MSNILFVICKDFIITQIRSFGTVCSGERFNVTTYRIEAAIHPYDEIHSSKLYL